jgi:hypothetical protein
MTPFPGEEVLLQTNKKTLTVTSKRVRYDNPALGSGALMSIMLSQVASVGIVTRAKAWLLILGVVFLLAALSFGLQTRTRDLMLPSLVIAALCIVAFLLTRAHVLRIASAGDAIVVESRGIKREEIIRIVDTVEAAKNQV